MIYSGKALSVDILPSGTAHLIFDLEGSSVNKFNQQTLCQLQEAVAALQDAEVRGVIFSSAKSTFIVGADITEFTAMFRQDKEQIMEWVVAANKIFCDIEDLPVPTVSAINGVALGGGMELALATDYRVGCEQTVLGFPEVKLGILPGFGGTVRLPRLLGADNANQWISSGSQIRATQALAEGALDAVVETDRLIDAAEKIIEQCIAGKLDYMQLRQQKTSALSLQAIELMVAFDTAKALVAAKAGPNYPAPLTAVQVMQDGATLDRAGALEVEHRGFVKLARSEVAANLVQMFLNDQFLAAKAKKQLAKAADVNSAAVVGAGIMGGGIAYQSALKGTAIIMKDILPAGIELGMQEAGKLLNRQVVKGRIDSKKMVKILSSITPTLEYAGFDKVDIVVEAVIENADIKKVVLAELEAAVGTDTIIASNSSTISIDDLASALQRPQNFCGMHFFNPVPVMPLVEVIRGEHSSDETVATTVASWSRAASTPRAMITVPPTSTTSTSTSSTPTTVVVS